MIKKILSNLILTLTTIQVLYKGGDNSNSHIGLLKSNPQITI